MKAYRLIQKGCQGYLCSILSNLNGSVELADVLVVNDLTDVFPNDLLGHLVDREVEFTVDIISGTQPISKTPYRMAPAKLKELKLQLQELLDKGFIRPSTSPWEHPSCLLRRRMAHSVFVLITGN